MKLTGCPKRARTQKEQGASRLNGGIRSYRAAKKQYTAPGYPCAEELAGQV